MKEDKPVNKWVKIITYAVGLPLTLFIAYKFINFLSGYIDFMNPSPLGRLQLILLALLFGCLAYYCFKRAGLFSKKSKNPDDKEVK